MRPHAVSQATEELTRPQLLRCSQTGDTVPEHIQAVAIGYSTHRDLNVTNKGTVVDFLLGYNNRATPSSTLLFVYLHYTLSTLITNSWNEKSWKQVQCTFTVSVCVTVPLHFTNTSTHCTVVLYFTVATLVAHLSFVSFFQPRARLSRLIPVYLLPVPLFGNTCCLGLVVSRW